MSTKVRVKDLAAQFGVSNKDIIQHLREVEVQVKSHMSSIEPEDVEKLKTVLKNPDQKTSQVVSREVEPGIIVRRRKARPKAAETADEQEEALADESKEETPVEAKEPVVDKAEEEAAPAKKSPAKKTKKAAPRKEQVARIIQRPKSEEEPVEISEVKTEEEVAEKPETTVPPTQEVETQELKPADAQAEDAAKAAAPVEDAPISDETPAQTVAEEVSDRQSKKVKKKRRTAAPEPQVRVISRPDPSQVKPTEPKSPSRPSVGRKSRPAPSSAPTEPGGVDPADGRKRKKRVVEFTHDKKEQGWKKGKKQDGGSQDKFIGAGKGRRKKGRQPAIHTPEPSGTQPLKAAKRKIRIDEAIRLSDMAKQMGVKAQELIKALFGLGVMATINQSLDLDTATLVASEFGYEVENVTFDEQEFLIPVEKDKPEELKPRPPIVTIMGHVDHGKTSLLDAIRKTHVTDGEAGGITQHIGAYHVTTKRGDIVFLDTPGHEAFTTMRARGAQVTDIVILVVAADDGVMDQTREAINHSRAAGVPIVVAVNKIDKEGANPDNVKRELAEHGLAPEDWGGDTIFANVSAKKGTGLDELLELVQLQAEVMELSANPDKPARGHIVEARLDKGRGPVGTMLMAEGTLKQGDAFVCGVHFGKVRAMFTDQGQKTHKVGPAIPVEIQGFDGLPEAGDEFVVVADDKVARRIAQTRMSKQREKELAGKTKVTLESFLASRPDQEAQSLNLVIKADVQGSLEAVNEALQKLSTDEIKIEVVHGATGAITESDILLASASQAIILGFNVRPEARIKDIAETEKVEIRFYDIIYKLVAEIKAAMSGMLAPDIEEVYLGQAEVRDTFSVSKIGTIAGCFVVDGKLSRNAQIRLLRDGAVIYTGSLASLKRFKDDAKEVAKGYECGASLERFNDIKVGDLIEAFEEKEVARTLD